MCAMSYAFLLSAFALLSPITIAHRTTRRSLNFRPPREVYFQTDQFSILDSSDPHQTARVFLNKLAYPDDGYFIRKDSYTDANTGISHIYVRQVVNGLEVADGNINLNIRNGQVLSYGNSFFDGSASLSLISEPSWHQAVYCSEATTHPNDPACGSTLRRLQKSISNYPLISNSFSKDPRAAAYFFLELSHECTDPFEEEISCSGWLVTELSNKLEPIHARQVYVQTPAVDGFTTYVSVNDPSKIISVTDWVVDAPTPNNDGWISSLQQNVFGQHQEVLQSQDPIAADPELSLNVLKPIPTAGTYRVWRWGINDPESGKRTLEVVPADRSASPLGWHSIPASHDPLNRHLDLDDDVLVNFTSTLGNNAFAQENWDKTTEWKANGRPDGGLGLVFDFDYGADPSESDWESVEPRQYRDLSITQRELPAINFDKGGAEGDAVIVDAQDSGGFNNAFFSTPPDGRSGRCRMFLWNTAKPFRDGGLDAGILIHELSHGLSTRLTGGPRNSACLDEREAGGMGEGWGDFIATTVRSTSTYKDYPIGAWAANTRPGIRHFPYSVNSTGNPSLYDFLQRIDYRREVHAIGEVWAEILWVVSNKLIEKHGFSDFSSILRSQFLSLSLLKMARDAIIAADDALTAGENKCTLWKAFASRGLGKDAKRLVDSPRPSINGFKVPPECN
ncbi:peptidase M36 family [Rhizoctonia solani]|uniref:Extracellular metalloproteinase n=1 Tax=Rhizoctonia solani TaxID=456999 RepID=A0A8H7M357_9AGAM|nr:peptidase M36 family [Rhizoctonia solani]